MNKDINDNINFTESELIQIFNYQVSDYKVQLAELKIKYLDLMITYDKLKQVKQTVNDTYKTKIIPAMMINHFINEIVNIEPTELLKRFEQVKENVEEDNLDDKNMRHKMYKNKM